MSMYEPFSYDEYYKRTGQEIISLGEFQDLTMEWSKACFPYEIIFNVRERNHRFLEESLELVQSLGCTVSEAHQLVDYVFGRSIGISAQEVGGVANTLMVLCHVNEINFEEAALKELDRVWKNRDKIREKQKAKPIILPAEGM